MDNQINVASLSSEQKELPVQFGNVCTRIFSLIDWGRKITDDESLEARYGISNQVSDYINVVSGSVERSFEQLGKKVVVVPDPEEKFRWQIGLKSILDSCKFEVQLPDLGMKFSVRVCVTVCKGDRKSKIHFRIRDDDQGPRTLAEIRNLQKEFRQVAGNVLFAVVNLYLSHVKEAFLGSDQSLEHTVYTTNYILQGCDCDSEQLREFFDTSAETTLKPRYLLSEPKYSNLKALFADSSGGSVDEKCVSIYRSSENAMLCLSSEVDRISDECDQMGYLIDCMAQVPEGFSISELKGKGGTFDLMFKRQWEIVNQY